MDFVSLSTVQQSCFFNFQCTVYAVAMWTTTQMAVIPIFLYILSETKASTQDQKSACKETLNSSPSSPREKVAHIYCRQMLNGPTASEVVDFNGFPGDFERHYVLYLLLEYFGIRRVTFCTTSSINNSFASKQ